MKLYTSTFAPNPRRVSMFIAEKGIAGIENVMFDLGEKMREAARWRDGELAHHPYVAGQRFTIADITAFCALEFARGLMKLRPAAEGMVNLQEWRDRIAARPSAGRP